MSEGKLSLKLSPQARRDFKEILNYTRKTWGIEQRDRYKALLDSVLTTIAANPSIGKQRDEIRSDYYSYYLGSRGRHYIFYRVFENSIIVVRILHDSMDIERHLSDDM